MQKKKKKKILTQKKFYKKFLKMDPPFRPQKISPLPLLPWKLQVKPIAKHVNSWFLLENMW